MCPFLLLVFFVLHSVHWTNSNNCQKYFNFAAPNFVSSMTQGDFVYFFFRETAVEYINCGKVHFECNFSFFADITSPFLTKN